MKPSRLVDVQTGRNAGDQAARPHGLSPIDWLFAMLDRQVIEGRTETWRAEVVSILAEQGATWVEIGPERAPARSVLMRLGEGRLVQDAIDALRAWTDLPQDRRPARIDLAAL